MEIVDVSSPVKGGRLSTERAPLAVDPPERHHQPPTKATTINAADCQGTCRFMMALPFVRSWFGAAQDPRPLPFSAAPPEDLARHALQSFLQLRSRKVRGSEDGCCS